MRLREVGERSGERPGADNSRGKPQDSARPDGRASARQGYCRQNCGFCCTYIKFNVHPSYAQADVKYWIELHGITVTEVAGQVWVNIPLPCSALQPDKSCGLYGQAERPQVCSVWPFDQNEIDEVNKRGAGCTFYFEE